jgi:hypothetical protein
MTADHSKKLKRNAHCGVTRTINIAEILMRGTARFHHAASLMPE